MIRWNETKGIWLKEERGIDLHEVAEIIEKGEYVAVIDSPSQEKHPNQNSYLVRLDGYICCVPFVQEENGGIFIKTAFRTRKFNRIFNKGKKGI